MGITGFVTMEGHEMPESVKEPILVWVFWDAPEELRALSDHGGDEDWLAEIPAQLADPCPMWMDTGSQFGCCHVSEHAHPTKVGWRVRIGAHA